MKKKFYFISLLSLALPIQAQVGIGTDSPNVTLDIKSNPNNINLADGLKLPSLTGDELRLKTASYNALQHSSLLYITTADSSPAGATINVTSSGYYFYDHPDANSNGVWRKLDFDGNQWKVQGTNLISKNNTDNIYQKGKVAIGFDSTTPVSDAQLEVKGKVLAMDTSTTGQIASLGVGNGVTSLISQEFENSFEGKYSGIASTISSNSLGTFQGDGTHFLRQSDLSQGISTQVRYSNNQYSFARMHTNDLESKESTEIAMSSNQKGVPEELLSGIKITSSKDLITKGIFVDYDKGVRFTNNRTYSTSGNSSSIVGSSYIFPTNNGLANQVLTTDGNTQDATLSWKNISDLAQSIWKIQNTSNSATTNTDNIYQNGKVAIGFDASTSSSLYNLEVKGNSKVSNFENFTGTQSNHLSPRLYYGSILGGITAKHAADQFSKGNMLFVSDINLDDNTDISGLFNNTSIIKNEFLRSGTTEALGGGVYTIKKINDKQATTGTQSSVLRDVNMGIITNMNQNQYDDLSNNINQLININSIDNHSNYQYGINLNSTKGSVYQNNTSTSSSIHLFHNNGITFFNKESGKAQKSYTFPKDSGSNNQVLTTNGDNNATLVWKNISDIMPSAPSSPRYFYFPTLSLPTNNRVDANSRAITYNQTEGNFQVDLFEILRNQIANPIASSNASSNALTDLILDRDKYEYFVIQANQQVFKNISFLNGNGNEGKLVYKVDTNFSANDLEMMNVIIKLK